MCLAEKIDYNEVVIYLDLLLRHKENYIFVEQAYKNSVKAGIRSIRDLSDLPMSMLDIKMYLKEKFKEN